MTTGRKNLAALILCALLMMCVGQRVPPAGAAGQASSVYLPIVMRGCGNHCPYFVSSSTGSDANTGTDYNHPIKTIAKVNSLNLKPGDRVLFRCGDTWRAEMLTVVNPAPRAAPSPTPRTRRAVRPSPAWMAPNR